MRVMKEGALDFGGYFRVFLKNLLEVKASEMRLEELESDWPVKTWLRKF